MIWNNFYCIFSTSMFRHKSVLATSVFNSSVHFLSPDCTSHYDILIRTFTFLIMCVRACVRSCAHARVHMHMYGHGYAGMYTCVKYPFSQFHSSSPNGVCYRTNGKQKQLCKGVLFRVHEISRGILCMTHCLMLSPQTYVRIASNNIICSNDTFRNKCTCTLGNSLINIVRELNDRWQHSVN